jgi:hypothetical protein
MKLYNFVLLICYLALSPAIVYSQDQAKAFAFVSNGLLTRVDVAHPGSGYLDAPPVNIVANIGSGATASAVISNGVVQMIVVHNPGSNFLSPPNIILGPPFDFANGLLAWWRAEDNVADELGRHDGQLYGGTYIKGEVGESFFVNLDGYILIGNDDEFNFDHGASDFSLEAWIFPI